MTETAFQTRIDVRPIAPRERHPLIFSTFAGLAKGESFELVNDHDPRPLFHQFSAELPGQFGWVYLEQGPDRWRVAIKRIQSAPQAADAPATCCGACGGH